MWFDVKAALAEVEREPPPPATPATSATNRPAASARVAVVAGVADLQSSKPGDPPLSRADRLHADATALLDFLRREGPHTSGAAASSLGCGATRAWQAEARLRAAGLVCYGEHGRAVLTRKGEGA